MIKHYNIKYRKPDGSIATTVAYQGDDGTWFEVSQTGRVRPLDGEFIGYIEIDSRTGRARPTDDPNSAVASGSFGIDLGFGGNSGIFGSIFGSSQIGNLIDSIIGRFTGNHLTGAEQEANAFSAQQSQLDRDFQAQQAVISRDWQEKMYNQYESPAAQISQYRAAGLNPGLMYGSAGTGSIPSASAPGGASASSVSPSSSLNLVDAVARIAALKAEIDNRKADTENIQADTRSKNIANEWNPQLFDQELKNGRISYDNTLAGIHLLNEQIEQAKVDTKYKAAVKSLEISLMQLSKEKASKENELLDLDVVKSTWERNFREQIGYSPDQPIWNAVVSLLGSLTIFTADKTKKLIASFNEHRD